MQLDHGKGNTLKSKIHIWLIIVPLILLLHGAVQAALAPEAGFIELEPVSYQLRNTTTNQSVSYTASSTRMWYSFQPADANANQKPLMILFNGGPGSTSEIIWGYNTSRYTVDTARTGGALIASNSYSWSALANLLYVDARVTGYSYGLMSNPSNNTSRAAEFSVRNFNAYIDGADFVRVLLRFLKSHPDITANPVIIVGESYGGDRAVVMLDLLLRYSVFGAGGNDNYRDTALMREIQEHYNAVFPTMSGQTVPPATIATQFGHQVLIQPYMVGLGQDSAAGNLLEKPGSPIYQLASEVGKTYVPCSQVGGNCFPLDNQKNFVINAGRDIYAITKPTDWLSGRIAYCDGIYNTHSILSQMAIYNPDSIQGLYAKNRASAYHVKNLTPTALPKDWWKKHGWVAVLPVTEEGRRAFAKAASAAGDLAATFGTLQAWDRYFLSGNSDITGAFYDATTNNYQVNPDQPKFGERALRNIYYVNTFITNARNDLVCNTPGIPPALAAYTSIVSSVVHDTASPTAEQRRGEVRIAYKANIYNETLPAVTKTIRFPFYAQSGHTVSLFQPAELFADVKSWLGSSIVSAGFTNPIRQEFPFRICFHGREAMAAFYSSCEGIMRLDLFSLDGKRAATLFNGMVGQGLHSMVLKTPPLCQGNFIAVLHSVKGDRISTKTVFHE